MMAGTVMREKNFPTANVQAMETNNEQESFLYVEQDLILSSVNTSHRMSV